MKSAMSPVLYMPRHCFCVYKLQYRTDLQSRVQIKCGSEAITVFFIVGHEMWVGERVGGRVGGWVGRRRLTKPV